MSSVPIVDRCRIIDRISLTVAPLASDCIRAGIVSVSVLFIRYLLRTNVHARARARAGHGYSYEKYPCHTIKTQIAENFVNGSEVNDGSITPRISRARASVESFVL